MKPHAEHRYSTHNINHANPVSSSPCSSRHLTGCTQRCREHSRRELGMNRTQPHLRRVWELSSVEKVTVSSKRETHNSKLTASWTQTTNEATACTERKQTPLPCKERSSCWCATGGCRGDWGRLRGGEIIRGRPVCVVAVQSNFC